MTPPCKMSHFLLQWFDVVVKPRDINSRQVTYVVLTPQSYEKKRQKGYVFCEYHYTAFQDTELTTLVSLLQPVTRRHCCYCWQEN